jgi:hypothetical protein
MPSDRTEYFKEWYEDNREKVIERTKEYGRRNREKRKRAQLKHVYGITLEQYDEMRLSQNNTCAICGKEEQLKYLAVDHDHVTGKVRALLCQKCNRAIGELQDDPELVRKAADYLERHRNNAIAESQDINRTDS